MTGTYGRSLRAVPIALLTEVGAGGFRLGGGGSCGVLTCGRDGSGEPDCATGSCGSCGGCGAWGAWGASDEGDEGDEGDEELAFPEGD